MKKSKTSVATDKRRSTQIENNELEFALSVLIGGQIAFFSILLGRFRHCLSRRQQFCVRRRRILQQIDYPQTVPLRELYAVRLLNYGCGGTQGVAKHKICEVGTAECYGP
jgi:hypothetical protein